MNSKTKPPVERAVRIPAWLLVRKEVSFGAKLSYSVLVHLSRGRAWSEAKITFIASSIGADERSMYRYLAEIESLGLISREKNKSENKYFFHDHPWMMTSPEIGVMNEDPSVLYSTAGDIGLRNPFSIVGKLLKSYSFRAVDHGLRDALANGAEPYVGKITNYVKNAHYRMNRGSDKCPNCGAFAFIGAENKCTCPECKAVFRRNIYE
jgi:rubredoxin|tara:strand:- start:317 stop:940 length:624 start_codon:yes stop_codon:yes gene_type:complete